MRIWLRDEYDWKIPVLGRYRYFGDRRNHWGLWFLVIDWNSVLTNVWWKR